MEGLRISSQHMSFDDQTIEFFGSKGRKIGWGQWVMNWGRTTMEVTTPDTLLDRIRMCVHNAKAQGKDSQIALLLLHCNMAVVFFLEGQLTVEHLNQAQTTETHIDIPNVSIDGRRVTVRIAKQGPGIALADVAGNML